MRNLFMRKLRVGKVWVPYSLIFWGWIFLANHSSLQGAGLTPQGTAPQSTAPQDKDEPKSDEAEKRELARKEAQEKKLRDAARKKGELTFDDLKFDIERDGEFKDEMLTDELKQFDKKQIKIRGFMLPSSVFQSNGIKQFVLVRDNNECCFGPGAMIYDCIFIDMDAGKTATYTLRPVTVKGTFEIDTKSFISPEGRLNGIFKMKVTEIK